MSDLVLGPVIGKIGGGGGSFQNVTLPQKTVTGQWAMSDWWTSPVNNTGKVQYWQIHITASNSSGDAYGTTRSALNQRLVVYARNSGSTTFCATLWPGYSFGIGVTPNDSNSVTMNGTAYYMELPEI